MKGYIYFAVCDVLGVVKIGYTKSPMKRLGALQVGCPFPVRLAAIMEGGTVEEKLLHKVLASFKVQGEWFWLSDQVLGVLNAAKEGHDQEAWK